MSKKDTQIGADIAAKIQSVIRHRKGLFGRDRIQIGKLNIYLDNEIPGLILDTFDNLGYETKDGQKPLIISKRKTGSGWHLIIHLPPGRKYSDVVNDREYFCNATNSWVELQWLHGNVHMDILTGELPDHLDYEIPETEKMDLPVPIGQSHGGPIILDLAKAPHMLIGGSTGGGKSNFLRALIHALLSRALIAIIDLKQVDFQYLSEHCAIAETEEQALAMMIALNKEYDRRIQMLKKARVVKAQNYLGEMPFIILVVDELAEIKNDETFALLDRIVRLARATGISVVGASQRTSVKVIDGDTRMNFLARLCFQVPTTRDSHVILGDDCGLAAGLPNIPGRAIYRLGGLIREVQTMELPNYQAEQLLVGGTYQGRWSYHVDEQPKQEKKRLPPRRFASEGRRGI